MMTDRTWFPGSYVMSLPLLMSLQSGQIDEKYM